MATLEELYQQYATPEQQDRVQAIKDRWAAAQGGFGNPQNTPLADTANKFIPQYGGFAKPDSHTPAPTAPNSGMGAGVQMNPQQQTVQNSLSGLFGALTGSGMSGMLGYTNPYDHSGYLKQMYNAALDAQKAQLQASYEQNLAELEASRAEVDNTYTEQKRQAAGTAEREAANWREMANAYGLNSGAIGQAALAQGNQLQSNLNALASAQAAAIADIERQRTLLGKEYQNQINQAIAENKYELANALYQEAVRQDQYLDERLQGLSGGSSSHSSSRSRGTAKSAIRQNHQYSSTQEDVDPLAETTPGAPVTPPTVTKSNGSASAVLAERLKNNTYTKDQQLDLIERYFDNGLISDSEANELLELYEKEKSKSKQYGNLTAYTK